MEIEKSNQQHNTFESIRQIDENGNEFWSARAICKILDYAEYRNFLPVVAKAKEACNNSGLESDDHFVDAHEMVKIGSNAKRKMPSIRLSRYACYLIVQNADPNKELTLQYKRDYKKSNKRNNLIILVLRKKNAYSYATNCVHITLNSPKPLKMQV
jgi:DNA-damage-inducible protein D